VGIIHIQYTRHKEWNREELLGWQSDCNVYEGVVHSAQNATKDKILMIGLRNWGCSHSSEYK